MPTRPEIEYGPCPVCGDLVARTIQVDTETGAVVSRPQATCRFGHTS
jgi:hypothetical protein